MTRPVRRSPPGAAIALASGILALLTWFIPPITGLLGVVALVNAWRASSASRRSPTLYVHSAIPLATAVLVLIAWAGGLLVAVAVHRIQDAPRVTVEVDRW